MSIVVNTNTKIQTQTSINASTLRDGLIYYVDAANPISYPVSSSVWYDLSSTQNIGQFEGSVWELVYDPDSGYYYTWVGTDSTPNFDPQYGGGIIYNGYTDNYPQIPGTTITQATFIGRVAALQPENITVNIWFKVSSSYFSDEPLNMILRSRFAGFTLQQNPNQTIQTIIHNGTVSPLQSNTFSSSFNLNQVYNYTFSLGNNKFKTYINGNLVYETSSFGNSVTYNDQFFNPNTLGNNFVAIGCDGDNYDRFFQGTVYNTQIFNRALSDTEVSTLFNYFNTVRSFNV